MTYYNKHIKLTVWLLGKNNFNVLPQLTLLMFGLIGANRKKTKNITN